MIQEVQTVLGICPQSVKSGIEKLPVKAVDAIEEIRLRSGRTANVLSGGQRYELTGVQITKEHLQSIIGSATAQSMYASAEMLRNGFITIAGGHRIGICGTAVVKNGEITALKDITSLNLRIARQLPGIADRLADHLWVHPVSTLLIGPAGSGKTTLLRDLVRQMSDRFDWRVAVVDERMELGACTDGTSRFDLGRNTDVLSGTGKEVGIELLLRGMNPQWIAVDEITAEQDVGAICRASYCGVRFLATAHAAAKSELFSRPVYRKLMDSGVFQNLVLIHPDRTYRAERMKMGC